MNKPTIEQIESVMNRMGMKVFTRENDVNLGAIRTKDNRSNTFNDWLFAFCTDEDGNRIGYVVEGTTDAGLYFRNNPMNMKGTAIIQHSKQYRGVYQLQDPKLDPELRGHKGQKAFRQVDEMDYWRDADRDNYLDFDGPEETRINFTNGHYMGTLGRNVNKWSAGCWGSTKLRMNLIFSIAQRQIDEGYGDKFSFTLLHENDFE